MFFPVQIPSANSKKYKLKQIWSAIYNYLN